MDELSTKLDKIEDSRKLSYVLERAEVNSATEACKNAGISRPLYYKWGKEERDYLDGIALELKRETGLRAKLILSGATKEAAEVKVKGLTNRDERIKQGAATEILDRMLGKPVQKQAIEHEVVKPVVVEHRYSHEETEEEDDGVHGGDEL